MKWSPNWFLLETHIVQDKSWWGLLFKSHLAFSVHCSEIICYPHLLNWYRLCSFPSSHTEVMLPVLSSIFHVPPQHPVPVIILQSRCSFLPPTLPTASRLYHYYIYLLFVLGVPATHVMVRGQLLGVPFSFLLRLSDWAPLSHLAGPCFILLR